MFSYQNVKNYQPKEQDYRIWLVVNPAVWLIPILAAVLLVALVVHSFVLGSDSDFNFLAAEAEPVAEEAAPAAAPAPAAEEAAPAAEEAPAAE